jgi:hypothetical protein
MSLPYIRGYYCPSEVEINLIQKESNRKIIDALRNRINEILFDPSCGSGI